MIRLSGIIVLFASIVSFYSFRIIDKSNVNNVSANNILTEESFSTIKILYPQNETIFPPEIIAPKIIWLDENSNSDQWLVTINFSDNVKNITSLTNSMSWTPSDEQWNAIKIRSKEIKSEINVLGYNHKDKNKIISKATIYFTTSKDPVGAPIFYREVNLPFQDAVKDPTKISWRFGEISSKKQPPTILNNLPVCGNCHSFSSNGSLLGMDVDYANDKGSYTLIHTNKEMTLEKKNIISWSNYKKEDKQPTYGLLSQVSPDGNYAVSTVKDRSVFVAVPNLDFSQLFFPVKGILAYYSKEDGTFNSLPGADDSKYVQSNPTWSPDGKYIVFAKSEAFTLKNIQERGGVLLSMEDCKEFINRERLFKYDLYRIPFNNGKGGKPEPLIGASNNGMSNYFAKYSPDGKWIVFCKANSFMLLQEDSELYIIPAEGGEARKLSCNTSRMNSWHSWSPNSKWIVFSSKSNSPYTQLFLTHIDENGNSSPAVLLSQFTAPDKAANIPEFVNINSNGIKKIKAQFVDDISYLRSAQVYHGANDLLKAKSECLKAEKINPHNFDVQVELALLSAELNQKDESIKYSRRAVALNSKNGSAHSLLGLFLFENGKREEGISYIKDAFKEDPNEPETCIRFGQVLLEENKNEEAFMHFKSASLLKPDYKTQKRIANILYQNGQIDSALQFYHKAVKVEPNDFISLNNIAGIYNKQGNIQLAEEFYRKSLNINSNTVQSLTGLTTILLLNKPERSNIEEAIQLSTRACKLTNNKDVKSLDLLSAAYAMVGNFDDAIKTANTALSVAKANNKMEQAKAIQNKIELFKKKKSEGN